MTEVQDTTDRKAKQLRRIARSLALAWAGSASLVVVLVALYALSHGGFAAMIGLPESDDVLRLLVSVGFWLTLALLILVPWISALVAWEWEVVGGMLLVVLGAVSVPLCVGILPLTVGILLLTTWWILESSRVAQRRSRQHERRRMKRGRNARILTPTSEADAPVATH